MIQLGNWVRIDTSRCDPLMECGHPKLHHHFHTRVGTLGEDLSIAYPDPQCGKRIRACKACGYHSEDGATHYFGVCFDGEHQVFALSELEDLGPDIMAAVPKENLAGNALSHYPKRED